MKPQEFVAVEIERTDLGWAYRHDRDQGSPFTTLWACDVSDPSLIYSAKFNPFNEGDTLNALEKLLEWSNKNHPDSHVDFVVWKKDHLTAALSSHNAEMFVADWIDFLSFHSGTMGLSVKESQTVLFNLHMNHVLFGVNRVQALAKEFKVTFIRSLAQKRIMEEVQNLSEIWKQKGDLDS